MKNQTVLITGASSGIGLELAKIFAREGYNLVLVARSQDKLQELAEELVSTNRNITIISKDLTIDGACQAVYDEVISQNIQIDILVNNAGFGDFGLFHKGNIAIYTQMIQLNIQSLTQLTYLFGKDMIVRKSGKILNLASIASFFPGPLMSVYYATKHYVLAFSEGIANEWQPYGVTVTALCPGPTQSGFQKVSQMSKSAIVKNKQLPTAKEVAEFGYKALMNNNTVAVHRWMNRVLIILVKFLPRKYIPQIIRQAQREA
jgi:short-subunit dehydrogenase